MASDAPAPPRVRRRSTPRPGRSIVAPGPQGRAALVVQVLRGFRMIFGSARRYDASVRRQCGIPGSLLWALSEVERGGGIGVNALAVRMALHQTTASNLVNALVGRGLVHRARDDDDRRMVRLTATTKGRRVLARAPRPHAGLLVDALERLQQRPLAKLHAGLRRLVADLRRADARAAGKTLLGE